MEALKKHLPLFLTITLSVAAGLWLNDVRAKQMVKAPTA